MKKLLLLLFSLLISTSSFGETAKFGWKDGEWTNGKWSAKTWKPILYGINIYIDKNSFKSYDGKVYWWSLMETPTPDEDGFLSFKFYNEGDCRVNRERSLTVLSYRDPLSTGESNYTKITDKECNVWPNDLMTESDLGRVCDYFSMDY